MKIVLSLFKSILLSHIPANLIVPNAPVPFLLTHFERADTNTYVVFPSICLSSTFLDIWKFYFHCFSFKEYFATYPVGMAIALSYTLRALLLSSIQRN